MNPETVAHASACFWTFLSSTSFREWCVVLAELVVAWIIYRELQENRTVAFLEKATQFQLNKERRDIYTAYFALPVVCNTLDEASKAFHEHAFKDKNTLEACDKQIALFNELGLVYRKHFWFFRNRLVTVLPHAAIYVWVFCRHYIIQRRHDAGAWFAKPFLEFTLESVKYVLKFNHGLCLRPGLSSTIKKELTISVDDLKRIRAELKAELDRAGDSC